MNPNCMFPATARSLVVLGAAVALLAPQVASAQAPNPKPILMLLLDTSGSMEWVAGSTGAAPDKVPPVCGAQGQNFSDSIAYEKSRLVVAQEVLTGTFEDYYCNVGNRYEPPDLDTHYGVAHTNACSKPALIGPLPGPNLDQWCRNPRQKDNGLIDLRFEDFKFLLATFHPVNINDPDVKGGLFSIGGPKQGNIDMGIRNTDRGRPWLTYAGPPASPPLPGADPPAASIVNLGQLIVPDVDDATGSQAPSTARVEREILSLRGFSATPLGPMLEDIKYVLESHADLQPMDGTGNGDPYHSCRRRIAILITDGKADPEGAFGYKDTATAMWALKNTAPNPVTVYVVGFNLDDESVAVLDSLDPDNGGPADGLFIADSPEQLAASIAEITSAELQGRRSRTTTVFSNATRSADDLQYQFNASYDGDKGYAINQVGYLNQTVYRCNASCAGVMSTGRSCAQEIYPLHEKLNSRTTARNVRFHVDGGLVDLTTTPPHLIATTVADLAAKFGLPLNVTLPQIDPGGTDVDGNPLVDLINDLGSSLNFGNASAYMQQLVRYVLALGGTMRCIDDSNSSKCQRMGAIRRATPVIQEPQVSGKYPLRSWNKYVSEPNAVTGYSPSCRPTMLYTGTHDGQIHAFRVDNARDLSGACATQTVPAVTDATLGEERWAIVPQHLFKRAHNLVNSTAFLMDGGLHVDEVLMERGDPLTTTSDAEAANWRSVLTGSYGRGGRGYIAMDVTNPMDIDTVEVLWEISNDLGRCRDGNCESPLLNPGADFTKLGFTGAKASYATAFISGKEVAIAILSGGANTGATEPLSGRVVYIVRMDTGEKLAEFSPTSGNVTNFDASTALMEFGITGTPAAYPNLPGTVASRAFVGDAGGRMWRIDLVGDPASWYMQQVYDPYAAGGPVPGTTAARQPVFGAPRLALTGEFGHVAVIYGTGDIDYVSNGGSTRGGVWSFSEVTSPSGTNISVNENWVKVLAPGEKITGEPEVFNKVAYFSSFNADLTDACNGGEGFVYGVDFVQSTGSGDDTTIGKLDEDGDPSSYDLVKRKSTGDVIPFGVQVIERPACFAGGSSLNAGGMGGGAQGISRGAVELVVNVAEGQFSSPGTVPPGVNPNSLKTPTITESLTDSGETIQSAAWGYVLY